MKDFIYYFSYFFVAISFLCIVFVCFTELGILTFNPFRKLKPNFRKPAFTENFKSFYNKLNPNIKIILNITLVLFLTRVVLYSIAYFGYRALSSDTKSFFDIFSDIWAQCDSPRYLQIAQEGYLTAGAHDKVVNIAFLPLYPMLIKVVAFIVRDYFYSGIIVSFISLVVACFYFYKLLLLDYNESTAQRALKYFLIYPFSLFLSAIYTESTFMALCFMCFYFARKRNWISSGIAGMLGAFCRTQGFLLFIPLLYEIFLEIKEKRTASKTSKLLNITYISVFLVPLGYIGYWTVNKIVTGEWFKFMYYQETAWSQTFVPFPQVILHTFDCISNPPDMRNIVNWGPQLMMFFIAIALTVFFIKRIRTSYLLYSIFFIILSYSASYLLSGPRYLIGVFPMFISAALLTKNKTFDRVLTLFCIMFLTILTICYTLDKNVL